MNKKLILIILLLAPLINVYGIDSMDEEACLACHSNVKLKAVTEYGQSINLHISKENYSRNAHAFKCTMCHKQEQEGAPIAFPHLLKKADSENCRLCHLKIDRQYMQSIHERLQPDAFQCSTCHDPHLATDFKKSRSIEAWTATSNRLCMDCHSKTQSSVENNTTVKPINDAHQSLVFAELHLESNRCVDCHTLAGDKSNHLVLVKAETPSCIDCHNTDSLLLTTLYREKVAKNAGLPADARIFDHIYMPGASKIVMLDRLMGIALIVILTAIVIHAAIRIIASLRQNKGTYTIEEEQFYGISTRIWHWSNALLFLVLTITGFGIHFTSKNSTLIDFSLAIRAHQVCGGLLIAFYLFYLIGSVINGNIKNYYPPLKGFFTRLMKQFGYYLWGIFIGADKPFHPKKTDKFNELQRISYLGAMFMLFPILILSGLWLLFPSTLPDLIFGLSGSWLVAMTHYTTAGCLLLFTLIHVYQTTTGDKASFLIRAMITGKHRVLRYSKD